MQDFISLCLSLPPSVFLCSEAGDAGREHRGQSYINRYWAGVHSTLPTIEAKKTTKAAVWAGTYFWGSP